LVDEALAAEVGSAAMKNGPSVSSSLPMCFAVRKYAYFLRRRCLAPVLALSYVVATVGLPWPTSNASRDALPFPCQGHRCGCVSAEQCWAHCCCFTPEQRLAWAAAHRVEPPAELVAAVSNHDEDEHQLSDEHRADAHSQPAAHSPAAHSCCHKAAGACDRPALPGPAKEKKTKGYGYQAFQCHGISTQWVTTGAVAPSVAPHAWTFDWTVVGTVPTLRYSLSAVTFLPAVPPPRGFARLLAPAVV